MLKAELVYVCDSCGKKAFPVQRMQSIFSMYELSLPDGWMPFRRPFKKKAHLCDRCYKEYRTYERFLEKQKEEEVYNGDFGLG